MEVVALDTTLDIPPAWHTMQETVKHGGYASDRYTEDVLCMLKRWMFLRWLMLNGKLDEDCDDTQERNRP